MAGRVVVSAAKKLAKSAAKEATKPRRRALRAPLSVTPTAAKQVKEILATNDDAIGVRLGVKTRKTPPFILFLILPSSVKSNTLGLMFVSIYLLYAKLFFAVICFKIFSH
jgi:hypothetical protein